MNSKILKPEFLDDKEIPRNEVLQTLVPFVQSLSHTFVIALNSPWGTGKTTFVRQFEKELGDDYPSIYYNAWQADYSDDPFIDFCSEILSLEDSPQEAPSEEKEDLLKYAKKTAATIWNNKGKITTSLITKIATKEIAEAFDGDEYSEEISNAVSSMVSQQFDEYNERKECSEDFGEALDYFVETITEGKGPLIIFVDELDRCRPTYAVELLERVKHLFDARNIVFILSVDLQQLKHAVGTLYGPEGESEGYLKGFDLVIDLPQIPLQLYVDILSEQYRMDKYKIYDIMFPLTKSNDVTLRNTDRIFTLLNILNNKECDKVVYRVNLIFFTCLKILMPDKYLLLKRHKFSIDELQNFLVKLYPLSPEYSATIYEAYIQQHCNQTEHLNKIKELRVHQYWNDGYATLGNRPNVNFDWLLNRLDFTHELTR